MSSEPDKEPPRIGRVVTFYSFKGGVGRSMALASISLLLSALCLNRPGGRPKGPRILVIDFDLEAPGLELYLLATCKKPSISQIQSRPGLVDLLKGLQDGKQLDWRPCITEIRIDDHAIDFLGSGKKNATRDFEGEADYIKSLQSLSWEKLFSEGDLGRYLEGLRDQWTQTYDYILVDSRTGASDTGDICTILLPDVLVALFVMNKQNIEGVSRIAKRAREVRQKLPIDRTQLLVVPIAARRESAEYSAYAKWEEIALDSVDQFYKDWLPKEIRPAEALRLLSLPYVPNWSFGERLPVIEGSLELQDPSSLSSAYARIARLIFSEFDWKEAKDEEANRGMQLGANALYQEKELLVEEKNSLSVMMTKAVYRSRLLLSVTIFSIMLSALGLVFVLGESSEVVRSAVERLGFGNSASRIFNNALTLTFRASEAPIVAVSISPDGSRLQTH